jgi:hypothetical protein
VRHALLAAVAGATLLATTSARAQEAPHPELALVPADWSLTVGLDVRGLLASRLWTQVLGGEFGGYMAFAKPKPQRESLAAQLREELPRRIEALDRISGIRVDRELWWLTLAVRSPGPLRTRAVFIASGPLDHAKVVAAWKARGAESSGRLSERTSGSTRFWNLETPGTPSLSLALLSTGPVIWGATTDVEEILARADAPRARAVRPVAPGAGLVVRADEAMAREIVASFLSTDPAGRPGGLPRALSLDWRFDGESTLVAEMGSDAAARDGARAVEGRIGEALEAWSEADAEMARLDMKPLFADVARAIAGITVQARGSRLHFGAGPLLGLEALGGVAAPLAGRHIVPPAERAVLEDMQAVYAAQIRYQAALARHSSGFAGEWGEFTCLPAPRRCLEGSTEEPLLDAALASLSEKDGYRRAAHGTPAARARELKDWAYTATPAAAGMRSFCVDSSGVVRFDASGAAIAPENGACPAALAAAWLP